jgi:hypothetical protein
VNKRKESGQGPQGGTVARRKRVLVSEPGVRAAIAFLFLIEIGEVDERFGASLTIRKCQSRLKTETSRLKTEQMY